MILAWRPVSVRVTDVRVMLRKLTLRAEERSGNAEAGAAADLGRRHQTEAVMDARRALVDARELWYTFMQQLHRFMIAVFRVSVNHDGRGGTAPGPLVCDQESGA